MHYKTMRTDVFAGQSASDQRSEGEALFANQHSRLRRQLASCRVVSRC